MPLSASIRRRPAGVVVVGTVEPEVQPWLRSAGHAAHACPDIEAALAAHDEPADLLIVAAEAGGRDTPEVCRALREHDSFGDAWLLAITASPRPRLADAALRGGADDFLPRPYTRRQLLARAEAGLRAARQRADDSLLDALLVNVPGAIYRAAWHARQRLELISDEIERISGYPPVNFIASERRTIMSIIHPDDRDAVARQLDVAAAVDGGTFALEYRIVRADGAVRWVLDRGQFEAAGSGRRWADGAIFDITERRAAEQARREREIEAARGAELRASRARIVDAADAARRKIERDLHDGAQQRLVALTLQAAVARTRFEADQASAGPFLEQLADELREASAELRELARGIHPAVLTERGLGPAIAALAARAPVPVEIVEVPGERLAPTIETTAYFTVAEALTNVAKYADATHATVRVATEDGALVVEVRDDGVGGAEIGAGSGLSGLVDRVGACEGSLSVDSPRGAGTTLRAVLPATAA